MNRFREPTAADDLATCFNCREESHHESMHDCDDGEYRCEDCFEMWIEQVKLFQDEQNEESRADNEKAL